MVEASQAGAQGCAIEVHEESRGISRDLQIGDHLRETDSLQVFDGFQLDDDTLVDEQIDPEPAGDAMSFVVQGNQSLALDTEAFPCQLDQQSFAVHRFQQARAEDSVHFDRATDDLFGQLFDFLRRGIHWRPRSTKRAELVF